MKSICIIDEFGTKRWYNEKGQLHREDGPACEYNFGIREWRINGILHREDGPALESNSGSKLYWLNGIKYTEEEYYRRINLKLFW